MTNDLTITNGSTELAHPAAANMPAGAHQRGITPESWHVMSTVLFKGASPEMICTLVDYCKARKLDPLKRPFHIVQVWDSDARQMAESIWPGIGELRTTAMRTGQYAGKSEIEFGPDRTETLGGKKLTFPEWAQCKVFRIVGGQRVEFAGSKVYWLEAYASKKDGAPNAMWSRRIRGQLAKCAEAEALRSAFPEELGHEYAAEEMDGQRIGYSQTIDMRPALETRDLAAELAEQAAFADSKQLDLDDEPESTADEEAIVDLEWPSTGDIESIGLSHAITKLRKAHGSAKVDAAAWADIWDKNSGWLEQHAPEVARELSVRGQG